MLPGTRTDHEAEPGANPDHLPQTWHAPRIPPAALGLWISAGAYKAQKSVLFSFRDAGEKQNTRSVNRPETQQQPSVLLLELISGVLLARAIVVVGRKLGWWLEGICSLLPSWQLSCLFHHSISQGQQLQGTPSLAINQDSVHDSQ